jgi:hypothetical protein
MDVGDTKSNNDNHDTSTKTRIYDAGTTFDLDIKYPLYAYSDPSTRTISKRELTRHVLFSNMNLLFGPGLLIGSIAVNKDISSPQRRP